MRCPRCSNSSASATAGAVSAILGKPRQGINSHDAEDLTQEFFRKFIEKELLANVKPIGKFRSFLLTCLKNFLSNQRERAATQRRGGNATLISLDAEEAERQYQEALTDNLSPETVHERRWAYTIVEQALTNLRKEYSVGERRIAFEDLRGALPGCYEEINRSELAVKYALTPGAVDVAVHRLRRRFITLLRELVVQTVSSQPEVDEEIRHLFMVLTS